MFDSSSRFLIVDDLSAMRKVMIKQCQILGYTKFVESGDGVRAWGCLVEAREPINLVIADWNMPMFSGLELLKKMRSHAKFKDLPLMMVTANSDKTQILQAIAAGVNGYIVKPFTAESLSKQLEEIYRKTA